MARWPSIIKTVLRPSFRDVYNEKCLVTSQAHARELETRTDQNVYHARTHFREERGNFSKVGANSRNQEIGVIFQA